MPVRALRRSGREAAQLASAAAATAFRAMIKAQQDFITELEDWLDEQDLDAPITLRSYKRLLKQTRGPVSDLVVALFLALVWHFDNATSVASRLVELDLVLLRKHFKDASVSTLLEHGPSTSILERRIEALGRSISLDLMQQIKKGLVLKETPEQILERLAKVSRGKGLDSGQAPKDAAEGLFRRYRAWALHLTRTEIMRAYNEGASQAIESAGLSRKWDATVDAATCQFCLSLHGQIAAPGEDFEGGVYTPPAHPHCRCRVVPWSPGWPAMEGERLFGELLKEPNERED